MYQPSRFDNTSGFCLRILYIAILFSILLVKTPTISAGPIEEGLQILNIGSQRQVFIDGRLLATSANIELVTHAPQKTGEHTLVPDRPWEGKYGTYNSVLKTGDTYHMWYRTSKTMCYARSKDGIQWEKPILGLTEYQGNKNNNIVVGEGAGGRENCGHGGMVTLDPTAPADERFRMNFRVNEPEKVVVLLSSPDGIHWKTTNDKLLTFTDPEGGHHLDAQNVVFWDDRIHKYVAYMRRNVRGGGSQGRTIARSESKQLGEFLEAQDAPIVLQHDTLDVSFDEYPAMDYYNSGVVKYPYAQDAYYMFPQAYFHYVYGYLYTFREEVPTNAGPLHTQFAASRDGIRWERFDRHPFVDLGMKGAFDSKCARMVYGMVPSLNGQELYLYYWGSDRLHGWNRDEKNNRLLTEAGVQPTEDVTVISRLAMRRDGFISARAAYTGGEFTTPLLKFEGDELVLNVDTSATGIVQCELQNAAGTPFEGFELASCNRIHTANEINRVVRWQENTDVSKLSGQLVRIRFVYRDADLYAFQFRRKGL